jgi:hypothetical protein
MMRNVRVLFSVLLLSIWNDINVIKKLHLYSSYDMDAIFLIFFITFMSFQMDTIKTLEGALAFLGDDIMP